MGSDQENSPSPESPSRYSSANSSSHNQTTPSPFKKAATAAKLSFEAEDEVDKKRKSIGLKLKSSYSKY